MPQISLFLIVTLAHEPAMLNILLFSLAIVAILVRRPIMERLRSRPGYQTSKLIEVGLLVAFAGMGASIAGAEYAAITYDIAFGIAVTCVLIGLCIAIFGMGVEYRRNSVR
jgi:hypothetical protein